jgi:hypothetical protein
VRRTRMTESVHEDECQMMSGVAFPVEPSFSKDVRPRRYAEYRRWVQNNSRRTWTECPQLANPSGVIRCLLSFCPLIFTHLLLKAAL